MGTYASKPKKEYECKTTLGDKKGGENFRSVETVDRKTAFLMDNNYSKSQVSARSDQYWVRQASPGVSAPWAVGTSQTHSRLTLQQDCGEKGTTKYRSDWKR